MRTRIGGRMVLGVVLMAAVGCVTQPYVYKADEFDRDAPDFNREPVDREAVAICFGRLFASRLAVAELAQAECGRFGKRAVAQEERFGACPMLTPIEARFVCGPRAGAQAPAD